MRKIIQRSTAVLSLFAVALFSCIIYFQSTLPDEYYTSIGETLSFSQDYLSSSYQNSGSTAVYNASGKQNVSVNLLGVIPIKEVATKSVEVPELIAAGTPFGVKMFTSGAIIVGFSNIDSEEGASCPGKQAGLEEGDIIKSINKKSISYNEEVAAIVEQSDGQTITIEVERNGKTMKVALNPVQAKADGKYKSGIWVRDSAAGIGTVTFVDPVNQVFAGLGHGITDVDTGQIMPVGSGDVCEVTINDIHKGSAGNPGELIGVFTTGTPIGTITTNNNTGIYGNLFADYSKENTYPMALKQEVKMGKATLLCSFEEDQEPKEYEIEINSVNYNEENEVKNMTITVTDPELIRLTGGIVQGMSGTPIIQNGKLIGAVTHVLVNDATKGYAIFSENMWKYASEQADTQNHQ